MHKSSHAHILRPKLIAVSVAACFALTSHQVLGNPTGATVMSGSAGFATAGSVLTVTNSANAVIHWQGFSIGVNETTRFLQPSAASAVLNRVVGAGGVVPQSVIDGVLSSNGRVFLLNPMGVLFSSTARVDVAGLVVSSLNLSDQDFQNGVLRFTEVPGAGGVANHGIIETPAGGKVFLIAPSVENSGVIRSPRGEIVLAAGNNVELVSEGSPFVAVRLTASNEQAVNVGSLIAESGKIGVYGALVRNSGVADASGAVMGAGGQIRFVATKDLSIEAGSRVAANGTVGGKVLLQAEGGSNTIAGTVEAKGSSGRGGEVQALGVRVGLVGHGVIDASGETGGGTVLVGGDYQGRNANVQNAQSTLIGSDGVIRADARTTGDGGRVIVWSDGDTGFHGKISARGGSQSGNGGFVETSGKTLAIAGGRVNLGAPRGKGGTWLLDPIDFLIDQPAADGFNATMYGGGTAIVSATQDIHFAANIDGTGGVDGGGFNADAGRDINLNSHTIRTNRGFVGLTANTAGYGGSITSTMPFGLTQIATNGGGVQLFGTGVRVAGIDTTSPNFEPGFIEIESTSGNIETGSLTTRGIAEGHSGGFVDLTSDTGSIHVNGNIDTRGAAGFYGGNGGNVNITRNGGMALSISVAGSILTGGGAGFFYGGSGGNVNINDFGTAGGVTVLGTIDTSGGPGLPGTTFRGGEGGDGGDVNISGPSVTLASVIMRGGDGGAGGSDSITTTYGGFFEIDVRGGDAGGGGSINVFSPGPVNVNGVIDASNGRGGDGGTGTISVTYGGYVQAYVYAQGGDGGSHAGFVELEGSSVVTQGIIANGGDGGRGGTAVVVINGPANGANTAAYAWGGQGGHSDGFYGNAAGLFKLNGVLQMSGGRGGDGGFASISVTTAGGDVYATADASGGFGGHNHSIFIGAGSLIEAAGITQLGGDGGLGGTANVVVDGSPVNVSAYAYASGGGANSSSNLQLFSGGSVGSCCTPIGFIDMRGGAGGHGSPASASVSVSGATGIVNAYAYADGGEGGGGGFVDIFSQSGASVHTGNILVNGGLAGNAGSATVSGVAGFASAYGGHGGHGGGIFAFAYGGPISTGILNARGGDGGTGASRGGDGGEGGNVTLISPVAVAVGGLPVIDVFGRLVIDTSGGNAAPGGIGGDAGHITIDPIAILLTGAIAAVGGTPDGHGGDITLHTGTVAAPGNIFFVNAFAPQFDGILNGYANGPGGPGGLAGLVDIRGTILYVFLTSPTGFVGADVIRAVDELEKLQDPEPEGRSCKP